MVLHGGGRWNFNRRDFQAGEAVFRAGSRAVQKASDRGSLDAEEATAATRRGLA